MSWVEYKNGNYKVRFNLADGTKIRETNDDKFVAAFAENSDVTITRKCSQGCQWCYEGCTPEGKHADIMNQKWIHSLHPYTELAINGNDMDHPQLIPFLQLLKEQKVIANITVNQYQFMNNLTFLHSLVNAKLIYGIGVSLDNPTREFINAVKEFDNIVIHTIAGILDNWDYNKLKDKGLKILILGYKDLGRGIEFHDHDVDCLIDWLKNNIRDIVKGFNVISFDNLALEQLDIKNSGLLTEEEWNEFYMGTDGSATFYLDAVNETFSKNSIAPENERYPLLDTVDEMFERIRVK